MVVVQPTDEILPKPKLAPLITLHWRGDGVLLGISKIKAQVKWVNASNHEGHLQLPTSPHPTFESIFNKPSTSAL